LILRISIFMKKKLTLKISKTKTQLKKKFKILNKNRFKFFLIIKHLKKMKNLK